MARRVPLEETCDPAFDRQSCRRPAGLTSLIPLDPDPLIPEDAPWLGPGEGSIPVAEIKRLVERWAADRAFEVRLRADPLEAARACGLAWNPEEVRLLWDSTQAGVLSGPLPPPVAAYRDFVRCKLRYRERVRTECAPADERHRRWRERQVHRVHWQLGPASEAHVHVPLCFELSLGCSVGCWFCGLDAGRLEAVLPYDEPTARLWRGVLQVARDVLGPASRWGFCYWATEPLDNPDYEKFLLDFHRVLGVFPQTTTAVPLRDVERTRRLLQLSRERGLYINRFSVRSLKALDALFSAFSPEDLLLVECLCQNPEARLPLSRTGRAARRAGRKAPGNAPLPDQPAGSIACVSGFLVQMVTREVRLVSPVPASDQWPHGFRVHARASFQDAEDLRRNLERMMESSMLLSVQDLPTVRLHPDLDAEAQPSGFTVRNPHWRTTVEAPPGYDEAFRWLGEALRKGDHGASGLAALLAFGYGLPETATLQVLQDLFERGLLDEDPGAPLGEV